MLCFDWLRDSALDGDKLYSPHMQNATHEAGLDASPFSHVKVKPIQNYICKVYYLKFLFHFSKQSSFCCACQPGTHGKPGSPGIPGWDGRIDRTEITGPAEAPGLQGTKRETGIQGPNGHKRGAW